MLSSSLKNNESLKEQLEEANVKIKILENENKTLQIKVKFLRKSKNKLLKEVASNKKIFSLSTKLSFHNIITDNKPSSFKYLCGLSIEKFNVLFDVTSPYLHAIEYEDCKGTCNRALDKRTELFSVLTICCHALHLGVMAHMLSVSESTVNRLFVAWMVFLETLFDEVDLYPDDGYLLKRMLETFFKTGYDLTDKVIDCTEFKFQQATNFDLITLMFSHYKNTQTGKALIGISPHGSGLLFSDIYPGSISDSAITEKTGVLSWLTPEHELMADRGFAVQDYCSMKGVILSFAFCFFFCFRFLPRILFYGYGFYKCLRTKKSINDRPFFRSKLNKRVLSSDSKSEFDDIVVPPPPKSIIPCYPLSTSSPSLVSSLWRDQFTSHALLLRLVYRYI